MKIRIIAGHCLGNARDVYPGDVLEVDEQLAARKIKNGWAVVADAGEKVNFWLNPPLTEVSVPAEVVVPAAAGEPAEPAEDPAPAPAAPEPASGGGGRGRKS